MLKQEIETLDWKTVTNQMHTNGHAILENFLTETQCDTMVNQYKISNLYRKTVIMERYRFGKGEYKYFQYPLPNLLQEIRESIYPFLAPIANHWMKVLKIATEFPNSLFELHKRCQKTGQQKPTVLILKYGEKGYNTLHQDLYGEIYFPIQMVLFLSKSDLDYTGGEFVLTEQVPRSQSKATVLKPKKGDALLFSTNFRPMKGNKGYYRATMRHGVSEVRSGNRYTLGIIFHDAMS